MMNGNITAPTETILLKKTAFQDVKNSKIDRESGSLSNIDESSIQDLHRNASNVLMSKIESFKLQEASVTLCSPMT
jgi:hypothetical protein